MKRKMIDLGEYLGSPRFVPQWLLHLGERFLGFHALNIAHRYADEQLEKHPESNFFEHVCKNLNFIYDLNEGGLDNIPQEGPLVIVSNHPHGLSDGLMFGDVAMKVRKDIRIVVNKFLECVYGMAQYSITVDVFGGDAAKRTNMTSMRELLQWLRAGHCVLVFPSGSAATYSPQDRRVIDDPWQTNIASIIRKTGAAVVPMHISGRTSLGFQALSVLCKSKRAAMLPREVKRDGRMPHRICLGHAIPPSTISMLKDDASLSDYLRLRTMLLNYDNKRPVKSSQKERHFAPLAPSPEAELLRAEVTALPAETLLYTNEGSGMNVYFVRTEQIPLLMEEIRVQRERTFRAVGEGTGNEKDGDEYDAYYRHLVMWDTQQGKLAGAYRIGMTDQIIEQHGLKGLYNANFFNFSPEVIEKLKKGAEMGRAFITPEYQRMATSLDTLWMGIGRFMNAHPQYQYLYGTVSISDDYSPLSRSLMLSFLQSNHMLNELCDGAKAHVPPVNMGLRSEDCRLLPTALEDTRLLTSLVKELENEERGIPVLLRQYLRLKGKMLSFAIDEDFGNTLDCLVLVDMKAAPERIIKRYCGA